MSFASDIGQRGPPSTFLIEVMLRDLRAARSKDLISEKVWQGSTESRTVCFEFLNSSVYWSGSGRAAKRASDMLREVYHTNDAESAAVDIAVSTHVEDRSISSRWPFDGN